MGDQASRVKRRKVFYIPGYDPFPPRRYRELYRKESRKQGQISGYTVDVRGAGKANAWDVRLEEDGGESFANFEVLEWSDIVQSSMARSIPHTYLQLFQTAWTYIASGALWRLMKLRQGPVIAALYPVVFLLAQLALAVTAGYGVFYGSVQFLPYGGGIVGLLLGVLLAYGVVDLFRRWDNRFFAYYLMHDYAYSAKYKGALPQALEARMDRFRAQIETALQSDYDEVLIVGHSSGAHLSISILADLIAERGAVPERLAFLSLGHVVPMVSFLPQAWRLRRDLKRLSASELPWVDVTAPGDGCAFALCDPAGVSGVAPDHQKGPLILSAAFSLSLSPERWNALKWRFFRLHFQYLCAFDRPRGYDYFQITAGALSLKQRFKGVDPSPSRKVANVNKYTSTSPSGQ